MDDEGRNAREHYLVSPKRLRQVRTTRANAKVGEIYEALRALAYEKGANSQFPTIRELCSQLNTSSATLTAALDLLETDQIIYRKERQGIFVSEHIHQRTIHIVFNITGFLGQSPFWSLIWAHIIQETERRAKYSDEQIQFHFLNIPFGNPLPEHYAVLFNSTPADGCILVGCNTRTPDHQRLLHVPHVVYAGGGDIMVGEDAEEKALLALQALVGQGCQRIACWYRLTVPQQDDFEVARKFLAQQRRPTSSEYFRHASVPPSARELSAQEQGYLLAMEVFGPQARGERPDGIYSSNDLITSGALSAWEELGIRVGEDVKVVSHANAGCPILFGRTRRLGLVEFDPADYVRAMFAQLDAAMAAGYHVEERHVFIRPRLRV